ncbi:response regulator [Limnoglobus roseus]|uniref:Response regulator n=1 Tax=Limnoglobus roseus TaxID=2598579 RepID=A0A5C1A6D1_9BACT|nr:response regulator [Limnoglobus roseus]QEL13777.1 response regulator [Limnoglobus roseus]
MKVLVVDDSRAMRSILSNILKQLGHQTDEAGNGQEAYEKLLAGGEFDLALVDWNMPVMNGLEFVQKVRAAPAHAGMPIVMVTTETEQSQMAMVMQAGANQYVMKPFNKDTLAAKLELFTPAAR